MIAANVPTGGRREMSEVRAPSVAPSRREAVLRGESPRRAHVAP